MRKLCVFSRRRGKRKQEREGIAFEQQRLNFRPEARTGRLTSKALASISWGTFWWKWLSEFIAVTWGLKKGLTADKQSRGTRTKNLARWKESGRHHMTRFQRTRSSSG